MNKKIKSYIIDNKKMCFDRMSFNKIFLTCREKKNISVLEYENELGELLGVSESTVHSWRFGNSGPVNLDVIKKLSTSMELQDYTLLLKVSDVNTETNISERQKDSLKRIYDAIIDYLDEFLKTDGFNDYWLDLCDKGIDHKHIQNELYNIAEKARHKVELVFEKEYIELFRLDIYSQLQEYVYKDLSDIYNCKLDYAYRFEAIVQKSDGSQSGITTYQDYISVLKKINFLLECYF